MAGTFLLGEKKIRPGTYYRREKRGVALEGATNGYCAALYAGNWGELNRVVDLDPTMINNLEDYVGDAADFFREIFIGGATTVRAVRVGGDDGLSSEITLLDTNSVTAVKISAKYAGDREFSVSIRENLITDQKQCIIYDGTDIFTSFEFAAGGDEAQALCDAMKNNRWFVAQYITSGELAPIAQMGMTGGTNPTVTVKSYSNGTNILERYRWNCIVADTNNSSVTAILIAFVRQSYETGHLGFTCIGGLSSDTLETRMTSAAAVNDEKVVYVLSGWRDIYGKEYEGWKAAARIGGMIAGCESNTSLTHDVIKDAAELLEALTNGEIIRAEQRGCFVLSLNDEDQVWVDNALTTLVTLDANMDEGWKKIRRTKTRFELIDRVNRTHDKLIGNVNNNENGRATILAAAQKIINEMISEEKLLEGSYVELDEAHPPEGDSVWLKFHILDCDSIEKLYNTFIFRYGNSFAED